MGVPTTSVITAGGGTKNRAWMQIVADMAGIPIRIPQPYQCSSFGDAMLAALGDGALESFAALRDALPEGTVISPNADNHEYYKKHYPLYRELYLRNRDLMPRS